MNIGYYAGALFENAPPASALPMPPKSWIQGSKNINNRCLQLRIEEGIMRDTFMVEKIKRIKPNNKEKTKNKKIIYEKVKEKEENKGNQLKKINRREIKTTKRSRLKNDHIEKTL